MTILDIARRWHWKAALFSATTRAVVFFVANAGVGAAAARRAAIVELVLRVPMVGALAAIGQTLSSIEPPWRSTLIATVALPLAAHAAELAVHWTAGTPALWRSMIASMGLSAVATVFNQFAMRRGVLLVGANSRPLVEDLKQLPAVCVQFLVEPAKSCTWVRLKADTTDGRFSSTPRGTS
jgi:hypothetical protein